MESADDLSRAREKRSTRVSTDAYRPYPGLLYALRHTGAGTILACRVKSSLATQLTVAISHQKGAWSFSRSCMWDPDRSINFYETKYAGNIAWVRACLASCVNLVDFSLIPKSNQRSLSSNTPRLSPVTTNGIYSSQSLPGSWGRLPCIRRMTKLWALTGKRPFDVVPNISVVARRSALSFVSDWALIKPEIDRQCACSTSSACQL